MVRAATRTTPDPRDLAPTVTYILPIRRPPGAGEPPGELTAYVNWVARRTELVVVDGSDEPELAETRTRWREIRVVPPAKDIRCRNGKVRGVLTGLRMASHERVIIADDDVRYDDESLARVVTLLDDHHLVVPQNHFDPCPWHAQWDGARSLVNRAFGHDYPGTLGVRSSVLQHTGGYDGDVLFENLELIRTVRAASGRVVAPLDLYVTRLPPTAKRFAEQRVRQAYDDFARPLRFAAALATLPALAVGVRRRRWVLPVAAASAMAMCEVGRRRGGGRRRLPVTSTLCGPAWWLERSICCWVSVLLRATGGCPYAGARLRVAAHSQRELDRRFGRG
jgi:hypothetical protein